MFENYTASFEIDTQRVELRLWDTSGKTNLQNPLRIILVILNYKQTTRFCFEVQKTILYVREEEPPLRVNAEWWVECE